ncbi:LysE family translocator [Dinoroseobacter sp. S124A]|uniref:LysE family translocator n=1 Tax=Dinoroseobacter sp. S124A TaxID=3415128 RepID=UPI003C7D7745
MELSQFLAFNAALLVAMASPGPALLVLTQTAISVDRRSAIWTGIGLGSMAALWTLAALLGLDLLFALFPASYLVMKTLGALYLIWIAWGTWKTAKAPLGAVPRVTPRRAFRRGVTVNFANPKSVLFASGVLVVIFPPDLGAAQIAFVALNHLMMEIAVYSVLAVALSRPRARRAYQAAKTHLDRLTAAVLGGLGLRLLLDRTP